MKCLTCAADTSIVDTRPWKEVFVQRRHECFNGHRFKTYEVPAGCLSRKDVALAQIGVARRSKSWRLRRAVLTSPDASATVLANSLGCTEARVRQIRKEGAR